ncbi:c-type cytochrome [Dyella choica]|uniref:Cytochrome c n=1 Tax=Dyella choica TaxID=1927959 RepID=A0A432M1W0_9GAMM|nr:cytochrome c [Dyella choica]RUL71869.1 cytochrome c [Dyella choica]
MKTIISTLAVAVILALLGFAYAWSGYYNVGADVPHWPATYRFLDMARDRSIEHQAESISVPKLDDPALILKGAGQYAAMCTGCHLAPGMHDSELRAGLYPQPPVLGQEPIDPREAFWVIKHGIKLTAMPAWGATHDDQTIWSIVAFVRKLPGMTPAQYKDIVAKAPPDEDMDMGHDHDDMPSH